MRRNQWDYVEKLPENLRALIHECEDYSYTLNGIKPPKSSNSDEDDGGPFTDDGGSKKTTEEKKNVTITNVVDDSSKDNIDLIKRFCQDHELHVVLNRQSAPEIQDYVKHFC